MKFLIIGGVQFVGHALVNLAVSKGHDVTVLAIDKPEVVGIKWLNADRNNAEALTAALEGLTFDVLLDNIAYTKDQVKMIWDIMKGRVRRYVFTSTVDTYGHWHACKMDEVLHETLLPDEPDPAFPNQDYARNKRGAETWIRNNRLGYGFETVVIRPTVVTGRRDNVRGGQTGRLRYNRSIFFPLRIMDGLPILLDHDDVHLYQVLFVDDLARALVLAAEHPGMDGVTCNAAPSEIFSSEKLVTELGSCVHRTPEIIRVDHATLASIEYNHPHFHHGVQRMIAVYDNARLRSFGWLPTPISEWGRTLFQNLGPQGIAEERAREVGLARSLPPRPHAIKRSQDKSYVQKVNGINWNYSNIQGKLVSSIGLGTFMGTQSAADDQCYRDSIKTAVLGGINLIDTAINYRDEASEIIVGKTLKELEDFGIHRDDVFLVSKGGYASAQLRGHPFIGDESAHCIRPQYINMSLDRSLGNLGTYIDSYLLHNPEGMANRGNFYQTLINTFVILEQRVRDGLIRSYGIATWHGLLLPVTDPHYIDLQRVIECANLAAAGGESHFKTIELPFNLSMPAAALKPTQGRMSVLDMAHSYGLTVLTSASVARGSLAPDLMTKTDHLPGNGAMRSLQVARAHSKVSCAIAGMRSKSHVEEALALMRAPPLSGHVINATLRSLLTPAETPTTKPEEV